jgi:hypothetical protein
MQEILDLLSTGEVRRVDSGVRGLQQNDEL